METENTEVLIVGGGPAGSLCGIQLIQNNVKCIIAERQSPGRVKLCAGVLTAKSRDCLKSVLDDKTYNELMKCSVKSQETSLRLLMRQKVIDDCNFTSKDMVPANLRERDNRFCLVDRPTFDSFLMKHYEDLGGKLIINDSVRQIDFEKKAATLKSGRTIQYKYLVACDGAESHTERLLHEYDSSFETKGKNGLAYEINVDREDLDIDGINIHFGYTPKTYAWSFGKGDKVCLGLCKLPGVDFNGKEVMQEFCKDLGLRHPEKYPIHGAMIPFDNRMPGPLWHDSIFFCGDAAGLDEAVTGEGIYFALQSGKDAADSIVAGKPEQYLDTMSHIYKILRKGAFYQRFLSSKFLFFFFHRLVHHHPHFLAYFYLTQIDHATTDSLWKIVKRYYK